MWIQIKGQRRRATGGKTPKPPFARGVRWQKTSSTGVPRRRSARCRRDRQMRRLPEKGGKVKIPGLENGMIPKAEKA